MKSNIEYLKESLSPKNEWIEAIEQEIKSLKKEIDDKDDTIKDKLIEISELEMELDGRPGLKRIECGIGIIEYIQPDNLNLQNIMEDFKEKHSVHAY